MAIGIEEVLGAGGAAGGMKLFLVEHERNLMRIEVHAEDLQMVGVDYLFERHTAVTLCFTY